MDIKQIYFTLFANLLFKKHIWALCKLREGGKFAPLLDVWGI